MNWETVLCSSTNSNKLYLNRKISTKVRRNKAEGKKDVNATYKALDKTKMHYLNRMVFNASSICWLCQHIIKKAIQPCVSGIIQHPLLIKLQNNWPSSAKIRNKRSRKLWDKGEKERKQKKYLQDWQWSMQASREGLSPEMMVAFKAGLSIISFSGLCRTWGCRGTWPRLPAYDPSNKDLRNPALHL